MAHQKIMCLSWVRLSSLYEEYEGNLLLYLTAPQKTILLKQNKKVFCLKDRSEEKLYASEKGNQAKYGEQYR